jgi:hypothetical protein
MHVRQTMLTKELSRIAIPPQSHGINLTLRPFVQIDTSNKRRMDSQTTMCGGTIQTQKDA